MGLSATSPPILWSVKQQTVGAVDYVLLGDRPEDNYRISLTVVNGPDGPEVEARPVYPCRVCGWELSCHNGEDCHS